MRKTLLTLALLSMNIGSAHAFLDSVVEKSNESGLMDMVGKSLSTESSPLTELLTSQLPVSTEQAAGGSSALLALAQSQLSGENSSELASLIPGLSSLSGAQSLLGNVESLSAVQSAFDTLGLDASMISQFAPVILQYLSEQGASTGLLDSLTGLWSGE
ncbi:DUF2780 domain-containing protein [Vibrio natriegens]|uniref:DUF2780 domain-containing protein n=1 Tax=Vibrio natriegens NBRC 15636 = ATCC 14048 = DSM 759 TaxID=1219067 RepID=A0AAN0Y097_VIBNA|nr:DUF2780 domain-containing protein [Vibrio natriegens]ALR16628.1 VcgC [Vibrio natriegens NBRC 15636 = ATCC 14048 = DSM 759]ANQ11506.1 hypothetical protein BA890_01465 [Vibrio natriegens NBRC 15636 = ATCC 14048 = DSM 759]EPM39059.1 hypothetical protein M272_19025 [Vibrio natriegens NBRC 15636 = ATCC 14048 = DSM 759]MDX6025839.1 DUF2780 domain-containing protein [Vibrio natriegens NBRC 15636 = ATCC 14048 = DSM 759]UUI11955.1 DUF2780 domain-containing protein [Vibrio natriegens]